ncbi:hypothetical protein, partial [Bacillus pumilus]|uniref:hypothetical protein n=1 Tax=Bacillus pumilus TaxID=1408 RepID=UPI001C92E05B
KHQGLSWMKPGVILLSKREMLKMKEEVSIRRRIGNRFDVVVMLMKKWVNVLRQGRMGCELLREWLMVDTLA